MRGRCQEQCLEFPTNLFSSFLRLWLNPTSFSADKSDDKSDDDGNEKCSKEYFHQYPLSPIAS